MGGVHPSGAASRPAVYTAIYGGVDRLLDPAQQDVEVDWYCFTDDSSLRSDTWKIVVQPGRFEDSRLSAKWPKFMPDVALPEYEWTVWVDANLDIDSPTFVRESLSYAENGLAVFRHPLRASICHEAYACLRRDDCRALRVLEQVRHYCREDPIEDIGLYACGVLVREASKWAGYGIGQMWLEECGRWTTRDQLSFPVLLSRLGIVPDVFPFHIGRAPWWLTVARYLGLTPGAFPNYLLTDAEARRVCSLRWFPPLRTFPVEWVQWGAVPAARPRWMANPWFDVRPHQGSG